MLKAKARERDEHIRRMVFDYFPIVLYLFSCFMDYLLFVMFYSDKNMSFITVSCSGTPQALVGRVGLAHKKKSGINRKLCGREFLDYLLCYKTC